MCLYVLMLFIFNVLLKVFVLFITYQNYFVLYLFPCHHFFPLYSFLTYYSPPWVRIHLRIYPSSKQWCWCTYNSLPSISRDNLEHQKEGKKALVLSSVSVNASFITVLFTPLQRTIYYILISILLL